MKRIAVLAACLILVSLTIGTASAQGIFGGLLPYGSSNFANSNGFYGTGPGNSLLPFNSLRRPVVYGGWVEHRQGIAVSAEFENPFFTLTDTGRAPLRGIWLGKYCGLALTDYLDLDLSGGILIPTDRAGGHLELSGGSVNVAAGAGDGFDANNTWYILDAGLRCSVFGGTQLVGGFRWNHFNTTWTFDVPQFIPINSRQDIKVNAFLPYFGVQVMQTWGSGSLLARAIGFPAVPGNIKWQNTDTIFGTAFAQRSSQAFTSGYFGEFLLAYDRILWGGASFGTFVRYNLLYARTGGATLELSTPLAIDETVRFTFDQRAWTLGFTLSLGFSLL